MPIVRSLALLAAATLLGAPTMLVPASSSILLPASHWPAQGAELSVMTYNVKGLPWPAASDRPPAIAAIGERLRLMRARGVQPHIVLLQEAFIGDAKRIGRVAGYRHVALGPADAAETGRPPLGREFFNAAQWLKGERSGSLIDSGLVVLSDFPIVRTQRYAFPEGACAGFDCLAAKGVLVTWIDVPGADQPIAVVDTHLNSRHSTHVPAARADEAYSWQIAAVRRLLAHVIAPDTPVIFGGDFNVGQVEMRKAALAAAPLIGAGQTDGLAAVLSNGKAFPDALHEILSIVARNKDRVLSRSGARLRLKPVRAWVPFRMATTENPLSDHAGFVVDYSFGEMPAADVRRPKAAETSPS